jgi:hypothetical protein
MKGTQPSAARRIGVRLALAAVLVAGTAFARSEDVAAGDEASLFGGAAHVGIGSPWNLGFAEFRPQSEGSADCFYSMPSEDNFAYVSSDAPGSTCCLVGPVHLPDGATVTSVVFYLRDESSDDVTLSLRRKALSNLSSTQVLGSITTSASGSGVRVFADLSISDAVVDNEDFAYFVSSDTCLDQGSSMRLYHAQVFFTE